MMKQKYIAPLFAVITCLTLNGCVSSSATRDWEDRIEKDGGYEKGTIISLTELKGDEFRFTDTAYFTCGVMYPEKNHADVAVVVKGKTIDYSFKVPDGCGVPFGYGRSLEASIERNISRESSRRFDEEMHQIRVKREKQQAMLEKRRMEEADAYSKSPRGRMEVAAINVVLLENCIDAYQLEKKHGEYLISVTNTSLRDELAGEFDDLFYKRKIYQAKLESQGDMQMLLSDKGEGVCLVAAMAAQNQVH